MSSLADAFPAFPSPAAARSPRGRNSRGIDEPKRPRQGRPRPAPPGPIAAAAPPPTRCLAPRDRRRCPPAPSRSTHGREKARKIVRGSAEWKKLNLQGNVSVVKAGFVEASRRGLA